ncbi:Hypothetical predicted protein, partial [Olea europaea subsp. europaea]
RSSHRAKNAHKTLGTVAIISAREISRQKGPVLRNSINLQRAQPLATRAINTRPQEESARTP